MKYQVTIGTYWHNGVKCKRGDIIEAEAGLEGARLDVYIEPIVEAEPEPEKPKRKRRTKAEMEAFKQMEVSFEDQSED